jgi:hypothetical protein
MAAKPARLENPALPVTLSVPADLTRARKKAYRSASQ